MMCWIQALCSPQHNYRILGVTQMRFTIYQVEKGQFSLRMTETMNNLRPLKARLPAL